VPAPLVRRRLEGGLLTRLLEDPDLAPALRALPAPALRQVILRVGLEDAGELIALSTLDQLREVFDEDLWRSPRPGEDETFDAGRFVIWLEVLLEGGDALLADRLAELSEDFVVFAFSQLVRVLDLDVLTEWATDRHEADLLDELVDTHPSQEIDARLVVSRTEWGWDAVLATLLALDERHPDLLREVLDRCAAATHDAVHSAEALHDALRGDARLLEDARAEREDRRAGQGYVSPADARAFLALARTGPEEPEEDPITRAHFREQKPVGTRSAGAPASASPGAEGPSLRRLLLEAGAEPEASASDSGARSLFRDTLAALHVQDPHAHQRVVAELAYLANVLIAGDTSAARSWRPVDAAERVLELCDEGLHAVAEREGAGRGAAERLVVRWGAVGLFRVAWAAQCARQGGRDGR
jgi:hypothetical protein